MSLSIRTKEIQYCNTDSIGSTTNVYSVDTLMKSIQKKPLNIKTKIQTFFLFQSSTKQSYKYFFLLLTMLECFSLPNTFSLVLIAELALIVSLGLGVDFISTLQTLFTNELNKLECLCLTGITSFVFASKAGAFTSVGPPL